MRKIFLMLTAFILMVFVLSGCSRQTELPNQSSEIVTKDVAVYPITSITIPNTCDGFTSVSIDTVQNFFVAEDNLKYTTVDGVVFTKDLKTLVAFPAGRTGSYTIPDGTEIIGANAFENGRIEEVYVPDSVIQIGSQAFAGCMRLKELSLPTEFTAEGIILPHCEAVPEYALNGLQIHHRGELNVKIEEVLPELNCFMEDAYHSENIVGSHVRELHMYEWERDRENREMVYTTTTAEYLLDGGDIVIPEGYTSWTVGDLRYARMPITSITFPNSLSAQGYAAFNNKMTSESFFAWDSFGTNSISIKNLYVHEDNARYVSVDGVIFTRDLKELVAFPVGRKGSYTIPEGTERIGYAAFMDAAVESVYIPDSVTSIGDLALYSLHIKEISLPKSVNDKVYFLPHDSAGLTVYYRGSKQDLYAIGLDSWISDSILARFVFEE